MATYYDPEAVTEWGTYFTMYPEYADQLKRMLKAHQLTVQPLWAEVSWARIRHGLDVLVYNPAGCQGGLTENLGASILAEWYLGHDEWVCGAAVRCLYDEIRGYDSDLQ